MIKTSPDGEQLCPIVESIKVIGSMWRLIVVRYLMEGEKGFNELLRSSPGLHAKTLSRTLKQLEAQGIVERLVVSTRPFSVRYRLTPKGEALRPVFEALREWGRAWLLPAEQRASAVLSGVKRQKLDICEA
mgnify:FL=1